MYTEKVIEHFKNPHNQGEMDNPTVVGQAGNPVCGDVMKIYLKVNMPKAAKKDAKGRQLLGNAVIKDIKFETLGCAAAIAVSSALTDIVKGKTLEEALKVKKDDIVADLGGLPLPKIHCSMLGIEALHKAIKEYQTNN